MTTAKNKAFFWGGGSTGGDYFSWWKDKQTFG